MDREPNSDSDSALRVDFILMWLLPCVFIHFCRAVSYITEMRFHHQLMRFHKTACNSADVSDSAFQFIGC